MNPLKCTFDVSSSKSWDIPFIEEIDLDPIKTKANQDIPLDVQEVEEFYREGLLRAKIYPGFSRTP